jgi:hypothetical protein
MMKRLPADQNAPDQIGETAHVTVPIASIFLDDDQRDANGISSRQRVPVLGAAEK